MNKKIVFSISINGKNVVMSRKPIMKGPFHQIAQTWINQLGD
jgi:hypothetical protein